MDSYLKPMKLQDLAVRRMAVILSTCPSMHRFAEKMKDASKGEFEPEMEKVSKDIVANFSLPKLLEQDLNGSMKAATREIIKWVKFHENFLELYDGVLSRLEILEQICWTPLGTVDYRRTAEVLIFNRKLKIEDCYNLACLYCINEDIKELWMELPKSYKKVLLTIVNLTFRPSKIVAYWTFLMRNNLNRMRIIFPPWVRNFFTFKEYLFEYVATQGYETATRYFFDILKKNERTSLTLKRVAINVAKKRCFDRCSYLHEYQKYSDVLSFLMSCMSESEQKELCRNVPFEILKCLLDWPHQREFFKHARYVLRYDFLTKEKYSRLLFILASNSSSGFNYPRMFRVFFLLSPKRYKIYTLTHYANFLREFVRINDVATVRFIFRHLTVREKVKLLVNRSLGYNFVPSLVTAGRWDFLRLFIRESQLANESKEMLVAYFRLRFRRYQSSEWFKKLTLEIGTDQRSAKYNRWATDCERQCRRVMRKRRNEEHDEQPKKLLKAN